MLAFAGCNLDRMTRDREKGMQHLGCMNTVFDSLRQQIGCKTGAMDSKILRKGRNLSVDFRYIRSAVISMPTEAGAKHLGNKNDRGSISATEIPSCASYCIGHCVQTRLQANMDQ